MKKARIQKQFDHGAAQYDVLGGLQHRIVNDLLQQQTSPAELAVDLGCGTGHGLALLAATGHRRLLGVDIAPSMIARAKDRVPQASFVVADIEKMPLLDRCADLVVSSSAMQWCDLQVALREALRITRPGGQLLISTFTRGTLSNWRALWGIHDDAWFVTPDAIRKCLTELGVERMELQTEIYHARFTSFASAVASIRGLGAGVTSQQGLMSPRKYRAIREYVEAEIARTSCFSLPYYVTRFAAHKVESPRAQSRSPNLLCQQATL